MDASGKTTCQPVRARVFQFDDSGSDLHERQRRRVD